MDETFQGSCLCGSVRYAATTAPKAVSHCHCSQCRKSHGAAFASYGSVPRGDLRILAGAEGIRSYSSSVGTLRQFCSNCGSSLFWSTSQGEFSDWISIALGTLDSTFEPARQKHVHVSNRASWLRFPES
ncbi:GFA family protein [Pseudomonas sp. PDM22]|uniref:GFA family protein n=1 Tax=Pseudomonas sp. PDM22 TaxID=2769287 RepID=UPI00177C34AB|nr:GFA family protein [Pseudomonas sp. PDM22]MBD9518138.1 GFA family protein [Pseudomonas sp. PDM22]